MKEDFSNNFNIKDRKEKMQVYAKKALELTQNFLEDKIPQIDNLIKRIDYLGTGNEGMQIKMNLKESILSLLEFIQKFKNIVKQNGDTDYYKNVIDKINSTLYKLSKNNISVTAVSGIRG